VLSLRRTEQHAIKVIAPCQDRKVVESVSRELPKDLGKTEQPEQVERELGTCTSHRHSPAINIPL